MEASNDGKLVRQHHQNLTFRVSCAEGVRYCVQRVGSKDDGRIIRCPSIFVSRRHCEVFRKDKAFWIKDLGSSNGTYLNGVKLGVERERELRFGDTIGMGISHEPTDDEAINIKDEQYYIFVFKKDEPEVIDIEMEEDAPKSEKGDARKVNSSNQSNSVDSDEDIQIIEEVASKSSTPVSSTTSSPRKKPMPPPPPPPIFSESLRSKASSVVPSVEQPASSPLENGGAQSSSESTTSTRKDDQKFPSVQLPEKPKTLEPNCSSKSGDLKNKRPLLSEGDQPPVKRSKQDKVSTNSSSDDDSSDGLGDIDVVNIGGKSRQSSYSHVSSDEHSSDEESDDQPQHSWINIPTKKQDEFESKNIASLDPVKSPNYDSYGSNKTSDEDDEDNEKVSRSKYKESLNSEAIRDAKERHYVVKLQQSIVLRDGKYNLSKEIFDKLDPSSKRRMQIQFRESLRRNKYCGVDQSIVTSCVESNSGSSGEERKKQVITKSDSDSGTDEDDVFALSNKNCQRASLDSTEENMFEPERQQISSEEHKGQGKTSVTSEPRKAIIPPRGIQLLADAPTPRFAAKAQAKFAPFKSPVPSTSASKYQRVQSHSNNLPVTSPHDVSLQNMSREDKKQMRIKKLKDMESKRQQDKEENSPTTPKRVPQPAKIKLTTRNRNQGLMDSIIGSKSKSNAEADDELVTYVENNNEQPKNHYTHPQFNPMDPRLTSKTSRVIPHDPRLKQNTNESINSSSVKLVNLAPTPSTSNVNTSSLFSATSHKVGTGPNILKPGAQVILSPPAGIASVSYREKVKSGPSDKWTMYPPAVCEDEIYRRILTWRPAWLEEQKNMKDDPPILKTNESLTTTLSRYDSYDAYFKIYFPLLLSEIWACISHDATNKTRGSDDAHQVRTSKRTEYKIKIEEVKRVPFCGMVKQKLSKPSENPPECDWVNVRCHTWVKNRGEIDFKKDLIVLTLQGTDKNSGVKTRKKVFGFPLPNSEVYGSISKTQDCDVRLRGKGEGIKFSEAIVCKFGSNFVVDKADLGHVNRICNITPKLREFKALNTLGSYRLFHRIISPLEDRKKSWQSWVNQNPTSTNHEFISPCQKLNSEQKAIVRCISSRISSDEPELMLMHGPPGTGKTTTIVALVLQLLVSYRKKCPSRNHRILICTPSNAAIDEIMRRLSQAIDNLPETSISSKKLNMIRVGDSYAPELKHYTLDSKVEEIEEEQSTAKNIKVEMEDVENDIRDITRQIKEIKEQSKSNPIALESKLSKLREKEKRKNTLRKDLDTVLMKGKSSKEESNIKRAHVIANAQIICSTLSSSSTSIMKAFMHKLQANEKPFLCCIVDEASQTTEPETLLPLFLKIDKLLLVGDPHQLGATVLSNSADEKKYGQSLFSRHFEFYSRNKSWSPVMPLIRQYRMHAEIVKWPNIYFYDSQLQTTYNPSRRNYPLRPYYFINLSSGREHSAKEGQIENVDEVVMVKALVDTVDEILLPLNTKWTIGIITPYSAQRHGIRETFKGKTFKSFANLDIDTVDGFQGQERDIIIFSCVRTDGTGFLKSRNRLNVALTRAKHSLFIVGDSRCLSAEDMWRCLVQDAAECNNKYDVNPNFKSDLKLLKIQLCNHLKKHRTTS